MSKDSKIQVQLSAMDKLTTPFKNALFVQLSCENLCKGMLNEIGNDL